MVTLPGMRPNLFPNAEKAKPPLGMVSAVSSVNSPIVPVVANMGVNIGLGLSSFVSFFLFAAPWAEGAGATVEGASAEPVLAAPVSAAFAGSDEAAGSEVTAAVVSSAL